MNVEDDVEDDDVQKENDDDVEDDNVEEDGEKDDNVDVAEDKVEVHDVQDDEVKGEEDDDVENDDVEEEDRSQDRDLHFVRACAVEMHLDISQHRNLQEKMPEPRTADHTLREPAQTNAPGHFTRATLCENLQAKCRGPAEAP